MRHCRNHTLIRRGVKASKLARGYVNSKTRHHELRMMPVDPLVFADLFDAPADEPMDESILDRLETAISALPEAEREVILALWLESAGGLERGPRYRPGVSVREMASRRGVTRTTIRQIEKNALAHLKELLSVEA